MAAWSIGALHRYNIGQVAIGIADLGLAYQAFKIAVSINSHHAESFNNLGVLELRKGNIDQARSNFTTAYQIAPFMFEAFFNAGGYSRRAGVVDWPMTVVTRNAAVRFWRRGACALGSVVVVEPCVCVCVFFLLTALLAYKLGDFQESFELVEKSLAAFPTHSDSLDLMKQLQHHFTML